MNTNVQNMRKRQAVIDKFKQEYYDKRWSNPMFQMIFSAMVHGAEEIDVIKNLIDIYSDLDIKYQALLEAGQANIVHVIDVANNPEFFKNNPLISERISNRIR